MRIVEEKVKPERDAESSDCDRRELSGGFTDDSPALVSKPSRGLKRVLVISLSQSRTCVCTSCRQRMVSAHTLVIFAFESYMRLLRFCNPAFMKSGLASSRRR